MIEYESDSAPCRYTRCRSSHSATHHSNEEPGLLGSAPNPGVTDNTDGETGGETGETDGQTGTELDEAGVQRHGRGDYCRVSQAVPS